MNSKEFEKLLKEDTPKHILFRYTHACFLTNGVNLTRSQLQHVIDLKNGKEVKHDSKIRRQK